MARGAMIWSALAAAIALPVALAAMSPLLAWRDAIYIASGFAGMAALALMLIQPLLAGGLLPGLPALRGRQIHRWTGLALIAMVVAHVSGLWLTSAPDVIDALLLASPTPFSVWGVGAMWALFAAALLAALRRRMRLGPIVWRLGHTALVVIAVIGGIVHALLVEGTMETVSKALFCTLVGGATAKVVLDLRAWSLLRRRKSAARN
jgi:MYXO-CTERM domain-containing protein